MSGKEMSRPSKKMNKNSIGKELKKILPNKSWRSCHLCVTNYFLPSSQRIKANQIQKLLREEKEVLADQVSTIHTQVEAQIVVVRKLEEKERVLQNNIATMEKELA